MKWNKNSKIKEIEVKECIEENQKIPRAIIVGIVETKESENKTKIGTIGVQMTEIETIEVIIDQITITTTEDGID